METYKDRGGGKRWNENVTSFLRLCMKLLGKSCLLKEERFAFEETSRSYKFEFEIRSYNFLLKI